jgi:hypothetical protein
MSTEINKSKKYVATLVEGESYQLGINVFKKGEPKLVDAEVAEALLQRGYNSTLKQGNRTVQNVFIGHFEVVEATDEQVAALEGPKVRKIVGERGTVETIVSGEGDAQGEGKGQGDDKSGDDKAPSTRKRTTAAK